jgi:hypothetical protein
MKHKQKIKRLVTEIVTKILDEVELGRQVEHPPELNVYDFDDSLVETKGIIEILNKNTGIKREISAHLFHTISLAPHEEFVLDDFNKLLEAKPLPLLDRMKEKYKQLGPMGVSVCTARPEPDAVRDFMIQHGMGDIEIAAVGDAAPRGDVAHINSSRKRKYLRTKILERDLKVLRFFDDNAENCRAALTLKNEFPNIQIEVEQIKK